MEFSKSKQVLVALLEDYGVDPERVSVFLLHESQTATELADYVALHFTDLYQVLKSALCEYVIKSLTPEVWAESDVLVNPTSIPFDYDDLVDYIVVGDGSVKTKQDQCVNATYYGNVDLEVVDGYATVIDTIHPVHVAGRCEVSVGGHTQVYGHGYSFFTLKEHSRAVLEGAGDVFVTDNAFLESKSGKPVITASGRAQYLISGGSADIDQTESARGAILNVTNANESYKVAFMGDGLLFLEDAQVGNVEVDLLGHGMVVADYPTVVVKNQFLDWIVPRHKGGVEVSKCCLMEPLCMNRLKEDLKPYAMEMKGLAKDLAACKDEHEVVSAIHRYLPDMVAKGLNGDFLRNHFTYQALCGENIFVADDRHSTCRPMGGYKVFCFDNVLVNVHNSAHMVYAYEQSIVLADGDKVTVLAAQNSLAFGLS